jgi:hypothetical protein
MFYKVDRKRLLDFELALKFQKRNAAPGGALSGGTEEEVALDSLALTSAISPASSVDKHPSDSMSIRTILYDYLNGLLYDLKGPEGRTIKHFVTKQITAFEKEPESAADMVRQFCDSMHQYIIENRSSEIEAIIKEKRGAAVDESDLMAMETERSEVSDVVMMNLESSIIPRVFSKVEHCLKLGIDEVAEKLLVTKMTLLSAKTQVKS